MEENVEEDKLRKQSKPTKEFKDSKTNTTKSTGTKIKERWLLTRKTWRYMADAGKKLFPDGAHPQKKEDIPKVEEYFQEVSSKCEDFILWNPHAKKGEDHGEDVKSETDDPMPGTSGQSQFDSGKERSILLPDLGWGLPMEVYNHLLKSYGASTLHRVASRLLEEQLMEEDEFGYDDEGDYIDVDGRTMRSIGTQTDPYLDMCVQTDHDGTAEDDVNVGAETKAETEATVAYQRALMHEQILKGEHEIPIKNIQQLYHLPSSLQQAHMKYPYFHQQNQHGEGHPQGQQEQTELQEQKLMADNAEILSSNQRSQEFNSLQRSISSEGQLDQPPIQHGSQPHHLQQQQAPEVQQAQQQHPHPQRPVLKKFWARRESLTAKNEQQSNLEKTRRSSITSEKEKETAAQRGVVAAKLASLEATSPPGAVAGSMKQDPSKAQDKKKQNVFKLGLKCDIEGQQGGGKVSVEKSKMDKFKTINYDKTLRNIKSKWIPTPEEEEYIRSLERENALEKERQKEMKIKEKEKIKAKEREERIREKENEKLKEMEREKLKEKKKKKARSIQVGEPLPQFILNSFRINSPVEIIHATKRRLRRLSSKADSISVSSENSIPPSGMTSPRFSISVLDDHGSRDLIVSESEAYRLSQMGIPFVYKRSSIDAPQDDLEVDIRDHPPHQFQRSISAIQASGHISQLLYHLRANRLSNPLWGGSGNIGGRASDRAQRLTQSLLQYLLPTVMQRSRGSGGGGHASRLVAKRIWRTRSKSQSRASAGTTSIWTPMGNSTWMSVTGRVSTLEPTSLLQLSELERLSLQRISLAKLQALNLGCSIKVPKEAAATSSSKKRRPYLLKRKAISSGLFDGKKEEHKGTGGGLVFGLVLNKCIENERIRGREVVERDASIVMSGDCSQSVDEGEDNLSRKSSHAGSNASFSSLLEGAKQSTTGSLESLNLERKRPSLGGGEILMGGSPASLDLLSSDPMPQVPALVNTCCRFLETHGLHTLGIFRVSSSKKRVRQLREEFDSGKEIVLTEEHCPHDIATLLKEFFRDLPEPLLTRELYEPLISTQKIRNRRLQLEALQHLVQLLPVANRDTLYSLLNFLTTVADHSSDPEGDSGQGNKMDSNNLATLFAPNILHQVKPGSDSLSTSEMAAQAEERIEVINVVRCMIDHNKELFEVSAELLDETYQHLMDTHPEALDILLRRRCTGPDELDLEAETSSSVFEGSEASSPLPRSPTENQDFEKLRVGIGIEDSSDMLKRETHSSIQETSCERTRRRRRHEEEEWRRHSLEKRSTTDVNVEEKSWFRKREKSSSREIDKRLDHVQEKSRWFRRRDKTSPKSSEEKLATRQGSDKAKNRVASGQDITLNRDRVSSQESTEYFVDRRNKSISEQEKLRVPEPSVRRLSSPEIDTFGVITASLKIPVPLQQQPSSLSFSKETDIPYIDLSEEAKQRLKDSAAASSSSRQRTGSNDSFLGQPITGSMSFQPLSKIDGDKQSYDSVLSSSSMGVYTNTPSERNTPSSDVHCASGTSSPMSGVLSPPLWLSPDSGTPGLSPPNSPPPLRRRSRRKDDSSSKPAPLSHSATHTFGTKPSAPLRSRDKPRPHPAPIGRSRTTDVIKLDESLEHRTRNEGSRARVATEKEYNKKYTRKRYSAERHHSGHLPEIQSHPTRATTTESSTQLWKRWEIIASDPTEPETFV